MTPADLLADAFGRIPDTVDGVLAGIDEDVLVRLPDPEGNSIAWLVWHLIRVQDDHVSEVAGREQAWTADGWADRFGLPFPATDTGYGHSSDDVAALAGVSATDLIGYHQAVHDRTVEFLRTISDDDLAGVVDRCWDPPVTLAVRLVSVISDDLQHAGQAAYVKGVLERR